MVIVMGQSGGRQLLVDIEGWMLLYLDERVMLVSLFVVMMMDVAVLFWRDWSDWE